MTYYCGWDGGGSKTDVCVTDEHGVILFEKTFGPVNLNGNSPHIVKNTITDCIDFMSKLPGGLNSCNGLVIGIAGVSNKSAAQFVKNTVNQCGYLGNIQIMGDHEIALSGAISGKGAVLIAGTGSICFGRDSTGKTFRSGGYGYLIDDEGSGYAIGRDILTAVMHSFDGRGPKTCLTDAVFKQLNIDNHDGLITWLYAPETEKEHIAALAPLLLSALKQEDSVAKLIAEKAAKNLSALITATCKKANLQTGEVALAGSIITHFDSIRNQVTDIIKQEFPLINIISPRHRPAQGAANLAREFYS